jgi:serine protease
MPSRLRLLVSSTVLLLVACLVGPARAVIIDPQLKEILDRGEKFAVIPVLMVFPDDPRETIRDLEMELYGDPPRKRRDGVIVALKKQARKAQENIWEILDDPNHPGQLVYADMLYFADAIAFGADAELILALADAQKADGAKGQTDEPILFLDRQYDLLTGAGKPAGDPAKVQAAVVDTTWNVRRIRADQVWNRLGYLGRGILIGHLDTGVALDHPDLHKRLWENPGEVPGNGLDDDHNGFIDDVHGWDFGDNDNDPSDDAVNAGHGTHTAGTVVGDGTGGIQTGVAPGARLLVCKIFNAEGQGTLSSIWAAQQYCVENDVRLITMSVGVRGEVPDVYLRADRFNALALRAAGVLLFNSAGNDGQLFDPPFELGMTARVPAPWIAGQPYNASCAGVITVGGTAFENEASYFSFSQGPASWQHVSPWSDWPYNPGEGLIKPDLVAPAVGICSTIPPNAYSGDTWVGTSMACPQAAGVAALMLEKNPSLSPAAIDSLLESTADDLGVAGKDNVFGAGLIDAYAAVNAVNSILLPNLEQIALRSDPQGDGVLDPAELPAMEFTLANVGVVGAHGVVGYLEVPGNPYVSVLGSGIGAFPAIPAGGQASNGDATLRLAISPSAPAGFTFTMLLTVITAEGFQRTFDIPAYVGLPEHRTHDVGHVYVTVTDQGSVGYLDDQRTQGEGVGVTGQPASLFIASLWGGTSASYVCNNDLTADGLDPREWTASSGVAIMARPDGAQAFTSTFTDAGHPEPHGVIVDQKSWAYAQPARDDFVIMQYLVRNTGPDDLEGYHLGLFVDWDVIDLFTNGGGTDPQQRTVWVSHPSGPRFGVVVLGRSPVSNLSLIDNPLYVYPQNHIEDYRKIQFLDGTLSQPVADQTTDWSSVAAAGPLSIPAGGSVIVAFALVYGANAAEFQANVDAAIHTYDPTVSVEEPPAENPPLAFRLAQNQPNPFNPSTDIRFTVPAAGPVDLAVYDLTGRRIRTLVAETLAAGDHSIRWDGNDEQGTPLASGLYLYRVSAGSQTQMRKMMLVK